MTVNQINEIVNDVAKQTYGSEAVQATDVSGYVSLGKQVFSSDNSVDAFYKSLTDRIGKTVMAIREYESRDRGIKRDEMGWGNIMQKVSFKNKDADVNNSWASTQGSPYDVDMADVVVQNLFSKTGTFEFKQAIPDYQLYSAFTNPGAMGAFISGLQVNMSNRMKKAEDNLANLAIATNIALLGTDMATGLASDTLKANRVVNLLTDYNAAEGTALTAAEAMRDANFLKYASKRINDIKKQMSAFSHVYSAYTVTDNVPDGIDRFTPDDKMAVTVLAQFASAMQSYLEADTYHNEMVKLPNYEEVPFWQGNGTSFAWDDISKVSVKGISSLIDVTGATDAYEVSNVVAFVHDIDSCATIIHRRRDHSIYNPEYERFNVFQKCDTGYMVDLSENGVVFTLN